MLLVGFVFPHLSPSAEGPACSSCALGSASEVPGPGHEAPKSAVSWRSFVGHLGTGKDLRTIFLRRTQRLLLQIPLLGLAKGGDSENGDQTKPTLTLATAVPRLTIL